MRSEILEAIHEIYSECSEVEVGCYLYLSKLNGDIKELNQLSRETLKEINKMNRCELCGRELSPIATSILHTEIDDNNIEHRIDYLCPVCDVEEIHI